MTNLYNKIYGRAKWRMPILLFSSLLFYSCTTDQPCFNRAIQPSFIGFAPNELDTFILRRYKANDSFNLAIDTFKIYQPYSSGPSNKLICSPIFLKRPCPIHSPERLP